MLTTWEMVYGFALNYPADRKRLQFANWKMAQSKWLIYPLKIVNFHSCMFTRGYMELQLGELEESILD